MTWSAEFTGASGNPRVRCAARTAKNNLGIGVDGQTDPLFRRADRRHTHQGNGGQSRQCSPNELQGLQASTRRAAPLRGLCFCVRGCVVGPPS